MGSHIGVRFAREDAALHERQSLPVRRYRLDLIGSVVVGGACDGDELARQEAVGEPASRVRWMVSPVVAPPAKVRAGLPVKTPKVSVSSLTFSPWPGSVCFH